MTRSAGASWAAVRPWGVLALGVLLLLSTAVHAAPQARGETGALLSLDVTEQDSRVVVRLVGDQAMSASIDDIAAPPYRVFLDITNVVPQVPGVTNVGAGDLERVRVALNQSSPPVTRVVLDLRQPVAYWLERDADNRELRVVIERTPAQAPIAPAEADPRLIDLQDGQLEYPVWFTRAAVEIERLLAPAEDQPTDVLLARWQSLQRALDAVTPPLSHKTAHSLLITAAQLGHAAADTTSYADSRLDAASAAAGAAMLVRRAREINDAHIARAAHP